MVWVQLQIAPCSSLHFLISLGPFRCSRTYRDFNLLHRSLLKRFSLLIWLVCRSLQCLISALTQAGGGGLSLGSLVQSCCGEGGALQTNVTGVCGEHSQCSGHTGFAPCSQCMYLPHLHCSGSRLLYREQFLLPVPVFWYSTKAQTRLGLCSMPSPAGAAQAARSLTGALSPGAVHLIPSTVPASVSMHALYLFWGAGL